MLVLLVLLPLLAALAIFLGAPPRRTAAISAILSLFGTLFLFISFHPGRRGFDFVTSFPIVPALGIEFAVGADGLGLIMLLLTSIVSFCAIWSAAEVSEFRGSYYACLLLVTGGAYGAFASLDLFFFYAFHELALIPTFLLIGIWGHGNRRAAAWKITIYLAVASFILLIGLIMLYRSVPESSRTFDIRELQSAARLIAPETQKTIYLILLVGFGALVSLFPFHTWAPEAYASAPAPAAMLHAGVLKKFGLYGLLRVAVPMLPEGARHWTELLLVLLVCNIIYVGLVTLAQKRLDWMLGYSSVMHMGYIFLGIACLNLLGTNGAACLIFAHGLSIALLFALTGELRSRTNSLFMDEMGGLGKAMPLAAFVFGIGTFAAIGLPGFANFAGEIMVFFGAFQSASAVPHETIFLSALILALWGVVISAVYMLRAYRSIFMGAPATERPPVSDLSGRARLPVFILIAGLLWIGISPQSFVRLVSPAFRTIVAQK